MNKKLIGILLIIILSISVLITVYFKNQSMNPQLSDNTIRYVALGDSYTIGEGASEAESWPMVLTNHLNAEGVAITLVANPSVTGWTTADLIANELSVYDTARPTFATLLIGVNDWVQGVDKATFTKNLITILDHMQAKLPNKHHLVLVTIPDFGQTPSGERYGNGRDISSGISEFNDVIKEEGRKRSLPVVDIFPLSKGVKDTADLVAFDGLHPSAKEYALWEKEIYPVVKATLLK